MKGSTRWTAPLSSSRLGRSFSRLGRPLADKEADSLSRAIVHQLRKYPGWPEAEFYGRVLEVLWREVVPGFDPATGPLAKRAAYFIRFRLIDWVRVKRNRPASVGSPEIVSLVEYDDEEQLPASLTTDPWDQVDAVVAVRDAIKQLPLDLRELIVLRYYEQLSEREMAEQLGVPRTTMQRQLALAHEMLEKFLGESGPNRPGPSHTGIEEENR